MRWSVKLAFFEYRRRDIFIIHISCYSILMEKCITLRQIKLSDKPLFAKWWRDKDLLKLTSGKLERISDEEVEKYFSDMLKNKDNWQFMIVLDKKTIGHISLCRRKNNWHETQIVIGEKDFCGKGYGSTAILEMINKAKEGEITKIYLEVRPDNTRAIRVYEKSGFIKKDVMKYPNNKFLPETVRMEFFCKTMS